MSKELLLAVLNKDEKEILRLLNSDANIMYEATKEDAEADRRIQVGDTPLMLAIREQAEKGDFSIFRLLVYRGALLPLFVDRKKRNTVLQFAIENKADEKTLAELLRRKEITENINHVNNEGHSALSIAQKMNDTETLLALFKAGAQIIDKSVIDNLLSQYQKAKEESEKEKLEKLFEEILTVHPGQLPQEWPWVKKLIQSLSQEKQVTLLENLHKRGRWLFIAALMNEDIPFFEYLSKLHPTMANDPHIKTELFKIACQYGKNTMLEYFFKLGFHKVNDILNLGAFLAGMGGHFDALKRITQEGGSANTLVNENYETPLFIAVKSNNLPLVKFLLEKGADQNVFNIVGDTPLSLARLLGLEEMVKLFQENLKLQERKEVKDQKDAKEQKDSKERRETQAEAMGRAIAILKRAGHVLGMSGAVTLNLPDGNIRKINLEGRASFESTDVLLKLVSEFNKTNGYMQSQEIFARIEDSLKLLKNYLRADGSTTLQDLLKYHNQGNPLIDSSGWLKHDVGFCFLEMEGKPYVVYCNRGMGKSPQDTGATVYPLLGKFDEALLSKLAIANKSKMRSQEEMMKIFKTFIDFENPIARLPSKDQGHGTCSFVNLKSLLEGVYYLLTLQQLKRLLSSNRDEDKQMLKMMGVENEQQAHNYAMINAREEYKRFTMFIRNFELMQLLLGLQFETNPMVQSVYIQLFQQYFSAHHGQIQPFSMKNRSHKIALELSRAQNIILNAANFLPMNTQRMLFQSLHYLPLIADMVSLNDTRVLDVLLAHGFNINFPDNMGMTALSKAIAAKNYGMASYLIQRGAFIPQQDLGFLAALQESPLLMQTYETLLSQNVMAGASQAQPLTFSQTPQQKPQEVSEEKLKKDQGKPTRGR